MLAMNQKKVNISPAVKENRSLILKNSKLTSILKTLI